MIQLKIFLFDSKLAELGVDASDTEASLSIKKDMIWGVRERVEDGEDEISQTTCYIYTQHDNFVVGLSYNEMINLLK